MDETNVGVRVCVRVRVYSWDAADRREYLEIRC